MTSFMGAIIISFLIAILAITIYDIVKSKFITDRYRMRWVTLILLIPFMGALIYWVYANEDKLI